jgi:hypothetical protein
MSNFRDYRSGHFKRNWKKYALGAALVAGGGLGYKYRDQFIRPPTKTVNPPPTPISPDPPKVKEEFPPSKAERGAINDFLKKMRDKYSKYKSTD